MKSIVLGEKLYTKIPFKKTLGKVVNDHIIEKVNQAYLSLETIAVESGHKSFKFVQRKPLIPEVEE